MISVPFPEDVIVTILEELDVDDGDDRLTIQTCAFLSRSILHHCRRLLFTTFKVGEKAAFSHCNLPGVDGIVALHRFHNLLASNRHLIPFVRNLILTHLSCTKILCDVELPNLIRLLTHVVRLQVLVTGETLYWTTLPTDLTSSLSRLMSQPHFMTLKLCGISRVPIRPLMNLAGLRNISLHLTGEVFKLNHEDTDSDEAIDEGTITLLEARSLKKNSPSSPLSLSPGISFIESMSFGGTAEFFIKYFQKEKSLDRFARLGSLSVKPTSSLDVKLAWLIIRYAAQTLSSLEWSFSDNILDNDEWDDLAEAWHPSLEPVTLPTMRNLTTLSFTVTFIWCQTLPHPLTTWINFLETASPQKPMNFLRTILITFDCAIAEDDDMEAYNILPHQFSSSAQPVWDRFVELLGSSERFPALEELKISILVAPRLGSDTESSVGSEWGSLECSCFDCVDEETPSSDVGYNYVEVGPEGTFLWDCFEKVPPFVKERMSSFRRDGLHFGIEVIMSD